MSRSQRTRENRDKNKASLPQVPRSNIVQQGDQEEVEFAKELDQKYEFEVKPGFSPTGVRRKD
jgi:hypothetical protein